MDVWVDHTISALVSLDAIKATLAEEFQSRLPLAEARSWIEQAFADSPRLSWRGALDTKLRGLLLEVADDAQAALRAKVMDRMARQP
jgi:hypothetical protein